MILLVISSTAAVASLLLFPRRPYNAEVLSYLPPPPDPDPDPNPDPDADVSSALVVLERM